MAAGCSLDIISCGWFRDRFGEIGFVFRRAPGNERCTAFSSRATRQHGEGCMVPMTTLLDGALEALSCDVGALKEGNL